MRGHPEDAPAEGPPLPVETLRDWYVTVCGGTSPELSLSQVGINREALERNTSLDPDRDCVRVTVLGRWRRPYLMDRIFQIVPLDERHPRAAQLSTEGEAVFPEGDAVVRPREAPRTGDEVLLNGVLAHRRPDLPNADTLDQVLQELFRQRRGRDRENA